MGTNSTKLRMICTIGAFIGFVFLSICSSPLVIPIEQPYFTSSSTELYNFPTRPETMTITWERDYKKVQKRVKKYMSDNPSVENVAGLAEIRGNKCKVFAPEPLIDGDLNSYILAHEISHCFGMRH